MHPHAVFFLLVYSSNSSMHFKMMILLSCVRHASKIVVDKNEIETDLLANLHPNETILFEQRNGKPTHLK